MIVSKANLNRVWRVKSIAIFTSGFLATTLVRMLCDVDFLILVSGLRFNLLVSVFTLLVSIIAMASRSSSSGALGSLAVSYTLRLAAAFQWSVRNLIDVESYMTSCVGSVCLLGFCSFSISTQERLLEYTEIDMEPRSAVFEPDESWPTKGQITFDNVWMQYQKFVRNQKSCVR
jgi:ABC-type multidrug transport system fused ATPase/permease subunit